MTPRIATFIISASLLFRPITVALAVDAPQFPSCINPSGSIIAHYDEGTHGIAGDSGTYVGKDTVYDLGNNRVTQCYCSTDGKGIQTNWWNASSLSQDQVEVLKKQGWHYIPNGNVWGLTADPYLAQNSTYSCLPTGGGDPNGGGDGKSDGKSDGRSSCPECTAPPVGGQVLGTSTGDVLGLAATGDTWMLYTVFGAALFLLIAGAARLRKS